MILCKCKEIKSLKELRAEIIFQKKSESQVLSHFSAAGMWKKMDNYLPLMNKKCHFGRIAVKISQLSPSHSLIVLVSYDWPMFGAA